MNNSEENCNDIHGINPLSASKKRVNIAVSLFPVLRTLVVLYFLNLFLLYHLETYFVNK